MRRLLSLTVSAGLAASSAALADPASSSAPAPAPHTAIMKDPHDPALPGFLRDLLVKAGVMKKPEPPMHPWVAWWYRTFDVEPPDKVASPSAPNRPRTPAPAAPSKATTSSSTTASR